MTDLGYFGPHSVTWRIHGDPVAAMVGGLRALLLQALHPEAMRLLYQTSNFQDDPWSRLGRTVSYVGTISFAPRAEADAAAARVCAVHRRLGIGDPQQLAWVHACLVDSFLSAARAAGLRLGPSGADRYVLEQVRSAELAGVPEQLTVRTEGQLRAYFTGIRPHLAASAQSREAARYLIAPPMPVPRRWVLPARAGWTALTSLAYALLPLWAQRMYRLPLPGAALGAAAGMRSLRLVGPAVPSRFREGPAYRDAKRRASAASG
jgi:uncharacterized protein (DUF2236 family)